MSLEDDLLDQAAVLASYDKGRPRQANLRRDVSSAYYALFHLLTRAAVAAVTSDPTLRRQVGRALGHTEMRKACQLFLHPGGLQEPVRTLTGLVTPPSEVRAVAQAFVDLQEARHEADYNTGHRFRKADVLTFVAQARGAFAAWDQVRSSRTANVFLFALLFADRWKR